MRLFVRSEWAVKQLREYFNVVNVQRGRKEIMCEGYGEMFPVAGYEGWIVEIEEMVSARQIRRDYGLIVNNIDNAPWDFYYTEK